MVRIPLVNIKIPITVAGVIFSYCSFKPVSASSDSLPKDEPFGAQKAWID